MVTDSVRASGGAGGLSSPVVALDWLMTRVTLTDESSDFFSTVCTRWISLKPADCQLLPVGATSIWIAADSSGPNLLRAVVTEFIGSTFSPNSLKRLMALKLLDLWESSTRSTYLPSVSGLRRSTG